MPADADLAVVPEVRQSQASTKSSTSSSSTADSTNEDSSTDEESIDRGGLDLNMMIDIFCYSAAIWYLYANILIGPMAHAVSRKIWTAELGRNLFYIENGVFDQTV